MEDDTQLLNAAYAQLTSIRKFIRAGDHNGVGENIEEVLLHLHNVPYFWELTENYLTLRSELDDILFPMEDHTAIFEVLKLGGSLWWDENWRIRLSFDELDAKWQGQYSCYLSEREKEQWESNPLFSTQYPPALPIPQYHLSPLIESQSF